MQEATLISKLNLMSMYNKLIWWILIGWIGSTTPMMSQTCNLTLKGKISDESTGFPLEFATILIKETQQGQVADSLGLFVMNQLCPGAYHLQISHLEGENEVIFIQLLRDTSLDITLHHHAELLNEISVHGTQQQTTSQSVNSISKDEIARNANKSLAELLEKISGVQSLKSGSGISKPVIHGLYGNRITILNNGMVQSGQQWGNDHAPEIDPFLSDHISVVKGAASLAYGGNGLGSVVMIENNAIDADPHLHGQVNYVYQTNGRGHTANLKLLQARPSLAWKLSGTIKYQGDNRAPDYLLTNTGKNEYNIGLQMDKKISSVWNMRLHASTFNTEIGVLRGSHIGNVTDLEEAIHRDMPFFTSDHFSYDIASPRQEVHHHLAKLENRWQVNNHTLWSLNFGSQLDDRKEYDVRRGGRSNIPALQLRQYSQLIEGAYHHTYAHDLDLKSGVQFQFVDNTNHPETGVLPLIPDYQSVKPSVYSILQKAWGKSMLEGGLRLDCQNLLAITISRSVPRMVERITHHYLNASSALGYRQAISEGLSLSANVGLVHRSPEINELYSYGLHQGVSGLEEGNPDLKSEKSIKGILSADYNVNDRLQIQAVVYDHHIKDYIYLQPLQEFRLTIRGAFPVYEYRQTDARLTGADLLVSYAVQQRLKWIGKYAYVLGRDLTNKIGLVNIPSNTMSHSLSYTLNDWKYFRLINLAVNGRYVAHQNHITSEQDYLPPPDAYTLFGIDLSSKVKVGKKEIMCSIQIENMLNTRYRDYLDRQRYFADEIGRNINLRINYNF